MPTTSQRGRNIRSKFDLKRGHAGSTLQSLPAANIGCCMARPRAIHAMPALRDTGCTSGFKPGKLPSNRRAADGQWQVIQCRWRHRLQASVIEGSGGMKQCRHGVWVTLRLGRNVRCFNALCSQDEHGGAGDFSSRYMADTLPLRNVHEPPQPARTMRVTLLTGLDLTVNHDQTWAQQRTTLCQAD
jgi:hypothetical protein